MTTRLPSVLLLVLVFSGLTGCAFTKETVQFSFQPPAFQQTGGAETLISVQKLRDVRGSDPFLLANKGVHGKTSGAYVTEREVADLVTDALKESLSRMNYKVTSGTGNLSLGGDILKYDSEVLVGFWAGAMECSIQLNLKLSDSKTGALLWTEVLSGYNKITGLQVDRAAHRTMVADAALQDAMTKLSESVGFRNAVLNYQPK